MGLGQRVAVTFVRAEGSLGRTGKVPCRSMSRSKGRTGRDKKRARAENGLWIGSKRSCLREIQCLPRDGNVGKAVQSLRIAPLEGRKLEFGARARS